MKKVTIIGLNGGFGMLFSGLLLKEGLDLVGVDIQPKAYKEGLNLQYIQADIFDFDTALKIRLQETDCLLFCIPEAVLLNVFQPVLRVLSPGTLVIDTLSVKSLVVALSSIRDDLEFLSLNPLFAPDLGFKDQNVAAVSINRGDRSAIFNNYLREWGAKVTFLTAEEHDQISTITQVVTHFSLLCFGTCLKELNYQPNTDLFTPVHEILLSLLGRMISQNAEVYWKIQTDNPYGQQARKLFIESAQDLDKQICANELVSFEKQFTNIGEMTSPIIEELKQNFLNYQKKQD